MAGLGGLRVDVLGPLRVMDVDGHDVTPDGELQRRLLALLVLRRGETVTVDTAIDALWPRRPPRDPVAALQTHVFRLRRLLPERALRSDATGYRLPPTASTLLPWMSTAIGWRVRMLVFAGVSP